MKKFKKQIYEEFYIYASILKVQDDDESIVLGTSAVTAVDVNEDDASAIVLDDTTIKLSDDPDNIYTNNVLAVQVKAGTEALSPYQITFKIVTDKGNKWEIDVQMTIKET